MISSRLPKSLELNAVVARARREAPRRHADRRSDGNQSDRRRLHLSEGAARAARESAGARVRSAAARPLGGEGGGRRGFPPPRHRHLRRSRRADVQHQRSVRAAVQAAVRRRRCGAGAASELSAVRAPHAARIASTAIPYALEYHGSWRIDIDSVRRAATDRVRADPDRVAEQSDGLVSASRRSRRAVGARRQRTAGRSSATKCLPTIRSIRRRTRRTCWPRADVLTFSLGGLSKSAGLPQLKLGWIGFGGPSAKVDEALAALRTDCRHISVGVDARPGRGSGAA